MFFFYGVIAADSDAIPGILLECMTLLLGYYNVWYSVNYFEVLSLKTVE